MRDFGTIIFVLTWGFVLVAFVVTILIVFNLNLFPPKRLRNVSFGEVKIGQVFFDYGGEETKIREYIKIDELNARCLSVHGHPIVSFEKADIVKIEVEKLEKV
jgi:hypothetical protein